MKIGEKKVKENVSLAPFTTFKVGGESRYFFSAKTKQELISAVKKAKKEDIPFFILGGGSNLLVSEKGYEGLAIKQRMGKIEIDDNRIYAESGASVKRVVKVCLDNGLTGMEWAEGIPGTVGGAVYGNIGAFGVFISEVVEKVEALDESDLKQKSFFRKECNFSLKSSVFKDSSYGLIILSVILNFEKGGKKEIEKRMKEYSEYRKKNHPLNYPSAGCIFKNVEYRNLTEDLLNRFPELELFEQSKYVPAGFLIEESGLKGKKIGGAEISRKHANFIVNKGGAEAKDIYNLINLIKMEVKDRFGIELEEEIRYVGF